MMVFLLNRRTVATVLRFEILLREIGRSCRWRPLAIPDRSNCIEILKAPFLRSSSREDAEDELLHLLNYSMMQGRKYKMEMI
jgi:hypothetical protein